MKQLDGTPQQNIWKGSKNGLWWLDQNQQQQQQQNQQYVPKTSGKYVWWDRNWVPYDPSNPQHQGLPQYDTAINIAPGSTPYYANDVTSALMQNAFPGAAAGYAFNSIYLEPQRQQNIREMLNLSTQGGANMAAGNYQKALQQGAYGRAAQVGASLFGNGGGGAQFKASNLLQQMNQANAGAAQYRAQTTDPYAIAARRNAVIGQGFNNPAAQGVAQWIPGLEPQRQNNNFLSQLTGAASNILPYLNYGKGQ